MGAHTSSSPPHTSLVFRLCSSQFPRRVYYYFYEGTRKFILKARTGSKGLSTLESMLAGLIAGSATTVISNPIWVVQTTQAVYSLPASPSPPSSSSDPSTPAPPPPSSSEAASASSSGKPLPHLAAIAIGANVGDRFQNIECALRLLEAPGADLEKWIGSPRVVVVDTSFM